jgi:peptidoglycan/xylan/chitin deacetylase (PgdA/CDA1 family)
MDRPVPILSYHSVSWDATPAYKNFTLTPAAFVEHMAHLRNHSFTPITVSQLAESMLAGVSSLPDRPVVLTFDDGLADFYTGAFPVLKRHGFVATLYITTAFVGGTSQWLRREGEGDRPMLSWDQISEIDANGIECGAHSHTHPQLDTLPPRMAHDEVTQSKDVLEAGLGHKVSSFAYPHGYHGAAVRQMVQQAGYASACAVKEAMSSTSDDRFALARMTVRASTDVEGLSRLLAGQGVPIAQPGEQIQTMGWRFVRRSAAMVRRGLRLETSS